MALGNAPEVADCLFIPVGLHDPGAETASVPVRLTSNSLAIDPELTNDLTMVARPEPELTELQVKLRPTDFGRTHQLTITADPEKKIEEVDEDNNSLDIALTLPAKDTIDLGASCPTVTTDPSGGSNDPTPPTVSTETPVSNETPAALE